MFKIIIQNWKKRRRKIKFTNGYNYAAGGLLKGKTPMDLDNEQCRIYGHNFDSFDFGINDAIRSAIDKGLVKDNRR